MIFKVFRKDIRGFAVSFLLIVSFVAAIAGESHVDTMSNCDSLLYACQENYLDAVISLLQIGTDVNCLSKNGNTPLSIACRSGGLQIVKILLDHGADVNIGNEVGVTPLYRAATNGHIAIVDELLKVDGINVNAADNHGVTTLFSTSATGQTRIVEALLKQPDINVNSLFDLGQTPLDVASNEEIKALLIEKGAVRFAPIVNKLNQFLTAVDNGDTNKLASIVSDQRSDLINKMQATVKDGFFYDLDLNPVRKNVEIINAHTVKVTGIFTAKSRPGSLYKWELRGMKNYFVLEYMNGDWFITETDFVQKLSGWHFRLLFIALFAALLFWMWMLIDCFKRNFSTRGRWFIFLFFFNIIAAVIYFVRIKMRNVGHNSTDVH